MIQTYDKKFISYALNLSKKNLGITSPNPVVSCVITQDNKIISTGVTAKNGRPHAEIIAINNAFSILGKDASLENSTLYVTLEPCSHTGQTSPCADEIIKHKFKKVVIATQDPDERVNGQGIRKLKEAGIEVEVGMMEKQAQETNKAFFKSRKTGLPYITLKIATSLDGKIATKNFDSKWITSEKARQFSHHLRAINDAIMVGSNTVKKDNPSLDCRILGLEDKSPRRVVISNSLDFDDGFKIFQNDPETTIEPTIILTGKAENNFSKLKGLNVEIIKCAEKDGKVDLLDACKKITQIGINSLIIEGGKNLATQFLKENLIDELIWIRNKRIIGNDGIAAIGSFNFTSIDQILENFDKESYQELEDDVIEIFRKNL